MLNVIPTHPASDSYATLALADEYLKDREGTAHWYGRTDDEKERLLKRASREIDTLAFYERKLYHQAIYKRDKQKRSFPLHESGNLLSAIITEAAAGYVKTGSFITDSANFDDRFKDWALIVTNGTGAGQTVQVTAYTESDGKLTVSPAFSPIPQVGSTIYLAAKIPDEVAYACIEQALYISGRGASTASKAIAQGIKRERIDDVEREYFSPQERSDQSIVIAPEAMGYLDEFIAIGSSMLA